MKTDSLGIRGNPRSMERTLANLTEKLAVLPPNDPQRAHLIEMIAGLKDEMAMRGEKKSD